MYNEIPQNQLEPEPVESSSRTLPLKCNQGEPQQVATSDIPTKVEIQLDTPPTGTSIQIPVIRWNNKTSNFNGQFNFLAQPSFCHVNSKVVMCHA